MRGAVPTEQVRLSTTFETTEDTADTVAISTTLCLGRRRRDRRAIRVEHQRWCVVVGTERGSIRGWEHRGDPLRVLNEILYRISNDVNKLHVCMRSSELFPTARRSLTAPCPLRRRPNGTTSCYYCCCEGNGRSTIRNVVGDTWKRIHQVQR